MVDSAAPDPRASSAPELCRRELSATAHSLRLGMDAQGNEAFVRFLDALQSWLVDPVAAPSAAAVSPWLGPLLEAQQRGDTLGMADLLEYRLLPHLFPSES